MKLYSLFKLTILSIMLMCASGIGYAQVVVGGDDPALALDFVTLQIEGTTGGFLFPTVTTAAEKALLTASAETGGANASGLVIYNNIPPNNQLEFWDATSGVNGAWVKLNENTDAVTGVNGITGSNSFKLGSNMIENTTIDQKVNNLSLTLTTGKVNVQNDAFVVSDSKVGAGTNAPTAPLHIAVSATKQGFTLEDAAHSNLDVLTSDANGNASWTPMVRKDAVQIKKANFRSGVVVKSNSIMQATDDLFLAQGRWLIIARATTLGSATTRFFVWLRLRANIMINGVNPGSDIEWIGAVPQNYWGGMATPQLYYITTVPASGATFKLHLSTSSASNVSLDPNVHGGAYFQAIRLGDY